MASPSPILCLSVSLSLSLDNKEQVYSAVLESGGFQIHNIIETIALWGWEGQVG